MNKLLSTLIAAAFAATTFSAVAADTPAKTAAPANVDGAKTANKHLTHKAHKKQAMEGAAK